MSEAPFSRCPLFIVGMPRSGTKLLRSLLNRHPLIAIPDIETEFLPFWHRHWEEKGDLSDRTAFQRFYDDAVKYPYFTYMRDGERLIEADAWYGLCRDFTAAGVFEALLRHDTGVMARDDRIWGDKSPSYVHHVRFLHDLFPEALIIHIVRDARDYCLSMRKAWNKSVPRAAHRWQEGVMRAHEAGKGLGGSFLELRYEDLLQQPEATLRPVCQALGIDFDRDMLTLDRPSENIGEAKGHTGILASNVGKYKTGFSPAMVERIESIARPALEHFGYATTYDGPLKTMSPLALRLHQAADGLRMIRDTARERSLTEAILFNLRYWVHTGNRGQ